MPFENFYKDTDDEARLGSLFFSLIAVLLVSYLLCVYIIGWFVFNTDVQDPEPETAVTEAERLRRVDALCSNLPRPERFYFASREKPVFFEGKTAVIYNYRSESELVEIMPIFTLWFTGNGWEPVGENGWNPNNPNDRAFKKGSQTVYINEGGTYFYGDIQIYCEERAYSFAVYD